VGAKKHDAEGSFVAATTYRMMSKMGKTVMTQRHFCGESMKPRIHLWQDGQRTPVPRPYYDGFWWGAAVGAATLITIVNTLCCLTLS
jgi:hypothetical protein